MSTTEHTTEVPQLRDGTEIIGPEAHVEFGVTLTGYARVMNLAKVMGRAKVTNGSKVIDTAEVHDNVEAIDHAIVYGAARLFGSVTVDGAEVGGNAYAGDAARIRGNAVVHTGTYDLSCDVADRSHFVAVGPIGSEGRIATFYRAYSPEKEGWVGVVAAGCFRGTIEKLSARLDAGEGWSAYSFSQGRIDLYDAEYRAFLALAHVKERSWGPITDPEKDWWNKRLREHADGPWLTQRLREYGLA